VAAGLTLYLLWISDPPAIGRALTGADWRFLAAAASLVLLDRALMAYRWLVLLRPVAGRPPFLSVLRVFFVSTFVGTFLPASVGGDAVRAYTLSRHGVTLAASVASVLVDRLLGVVAILLVAGAAALAAPPSVPAWVSATALALAAGGVIATALGLWSTTAQQIGISVVRRATAGRVRGKAVELFDALRQYGAQPAALVNVLAGSVGVQMLRVMQAWLLGLALGITAGPTVYFVYVPIILLVMLLPITINGIGTSQAAFVWLFGESGVAAAPAFALSVLFVALGVIGNLPGGILYAAGGLGAAPAPPRRA
jgi:hypothetical protein